MKPAGDVIATLSSLPLLDLDQISPNGTSMVVAPHPDDESLGCGGFIAESCARGRPPVVVVMTDGTASHPSSPSYPADRLRALRERETSAALSILGLSSESLHFMRLRDSAMPRAGGPFDLAVVELRRLVVAYRCKTIFAPWLHDPHCDHETTQIIVRAAVKSLGVPIYSYPVWGWLLPPEQFLAENVIQGWRFNITVHLDRKRRAIASHQSQYSDLINDDPKGFRLPAELLSTFERPYETFISTHP